MRWFEIDPCYVFHTLNAYDDGDTVVQAAVAALGGKGGGGRPDRAQGGAPSLDAADAAIAAVEQLVRDAA